MQIVKLFAIIVGLVVLAVVVSSPPTRAQVPLSSDVQKTAGPITKTIPTVTNVTVSSLKTLVSGVGSTNLAYRIIDEDTTNAIRCEYGTITGTAPVTTPTSSVGFEIAAGTVYWEVIAPNNRLDCIEVAGSPTVSVTVFPK